MIEVVKNDYQSNNLSVLWKTIPELFPQLPIQ